MKYFNAGIDSVAM